MKSFAGKVALISGASSGIGLALAAALAARGSAVAITGTSEEKLVAAKAQLDAAGARCMSVRFDVADEAAWRAAAAEVTAELGPIAFLGLNAGLGGGGGTIDAADSAVWNTLWQVNVMGVLHGLPYGVTKTFEWAPGGSTTWAVFDHDTEYFGRPEQAFMVNFRVSDLDAMLAQLRAAGVEVIGNLEESEYGRFGWAIDPEGTRFELWEPPPGG